MFERLDAVGWTRLIVLVALVAAPLGSDAAPASVSTSPAAPVACVVSGVQEERGTFLGNPSPAWKVVSRFKVTVDAGGTCVTSVAESTGPKHHTTYVDWHREDGAIVGVYRGNEATFIFGVDRQNRPMSHLETYRRLDSTVSYVHRWRLERDANGAITRMQTSNTVDDRPEWPEWDDFAYTYSRAGPQRDRTYVHIANTYEEINLVLNPLRGELDRSGGSDREAITVIQRDTAANQATCTMGAADFESCLDAATMDDRALRDGPLDVGTARLVDSDDFGRPTRVVWLPGGMGMVMDATFFAGEQRFSFDRLDRLKSEKLLTFRGTQGARTTYSYSPGCEYVQRDWARQPAACPRQLDSDFWYGWPAL